MLTTLAVTRFINRLKLLSFFPLGDQGFADELSDEVQKFAEHDEQLDWLGDKVLALHAEWPGIYEIRGVFCSRYKPKDGKTAFAKISDGTPPRDVPKSLPEGERQLIAATPEVRMLPDGHKEEVINCEESREFIRKLADAMPKMPEAKRIQARVDRVMTGFERILRDTMLGPQDRPDMPPTPQIITEDDVREAVRKNHEKPE